MKEGDNIDKYELREIAKDICMNVLLNSVDRLKDDVWWKLKHGTKNEDDERMILDYVDRYAKTMLRSIKRW